MKNLKIKINLLLSRIKWLVTLYNVLSSAYFHVNKDDLWIGVFIDRKKGVFYLTYFPCCVIRFVYNGEKWMAYHNKIYESLSVQMKGTVEALAKFRNSLTNVDVALTGIIKNSEIDKDGIRIIKDMKVTGVSFVPKDQMVDSHCGIKYPIDNEVNKEIKR